MEQILLETTFLIFSLEIAFESCLIFPLQGRIVCLVLNWLIVSWNAGFVDGNILQKERCWFWYEGDGVTEIWPTVWGHDCFILVESKVREGLRPSEYPSFLCSLSSLIFHNFPGFLKHMLFLCEGKFPSLLTVFCDNYLYWCDSLFFWFVLFSS